MQNNFRVLLAERRLKTSDVHKATGIGTNTLQNLYYERSKNPSFETLKKVADFLGVTIDELMIVKLEE